MDQRHLQDYCSRISHTITALTSAQNNLVRVFAESPEAFDAQAPRIWESLKVAVAMNLFDSSPIGPFDPKQFAERLISTQEAAIELGKAQSTVKKLVKEGKLKATMRQGNLAYKLSDVIALRESRNRLVSLHPNLTEEIV